MAAKRLARARAAVGEVATSISMPPENLVQPEAVRRLAWTPPAELTPETVADALRTSSARAWQVTLVADVLAAALPEPPRSTTSTSTTPSGPATEAPAVGPATSEPAPAAAAVPAKTPEPGPAGPGSGALGPPPFSDP